MFQSGNGEASRSFHVTCISTSDHQPQQRFDDVVYIRLSSVFYQYHFHLVQFGILPDSVGPCWLWRTTAHLEVQLDEHIFTFTRAINFQDREGRGI